VQQALNGIAKLSVQDINEVEKKVRDIEYLKQKGSQLELTEKRTKNAAKTTERELHDPS